MTFEDFMYMNKKELMQLSSEFLQSLWQFERDETEKFYFIGLEDGYKKGYLAGAQETKLQEELKNASNEPHT